MKNTNQNQTRMYGITFLLAIITCILMGCSGGSGGDNGNAQHAEETLIKPVWNLTGTWNVVQDITENWNNGVSYKDYIFFPVKIEQDQNNLTLTDIFTQEQSKGTISGNTIKWSESYGKGTITYNIKIELSDDKNRMTGTGGFTSKGSGYSYSGTIDIAATITGSLNRISSFDYSSITSDYEMYENKFATDGSRVWVNGHIFDSEKFEDVSVILTLDTNGEIIGSFNSPFEGYIIDISFDGTYLRVLAEDYEYGQKVYKLDTDGNIISVTVPPDETRTLGCRGTDLWVSDVMSIYKIDEDAGQVINEIRIWDGEMPIHSIDNLAFDGSYLWVTSDVSYRGSHYSISVQEIHQIDTSGNLIKSYFLPGFEPPYIPPSEDDEFVNIWTSDNTISDLESDGTYFYFTDMMSEEIVKTRAINQKQ